MHRLILGVTGCGKSTLAKIIAYEHRRDGDNVFVCDPWRADDWHCDALFIDPDNFIAFLFQEARGGAVIFDEAGLDQALLRLGQNDRLVAASRHYGYAIYFLAHRFMQISPTMRSNISTLYCFRQGPEDAAAMARQWFCPGKPLLKTPSLDRYEFLKQSAWKGASWHRIENR